MELIEHTKGAIWIAEYPVHYASTRFNARMTVIWLSGGRLILHSPCDIDPAGVAPSAVLVWLAPANAPDNPPAKKALENPLPCH